MRFEAFYIQYLNIKQINYMFVEEFVCGCIRILDDISLKITEFVLFNFLDSSRNTRISIFLFVQIFSTHSDAHRIL